VVTPMKRDFVRALVTFHASSCCQPPEIQESQLSLYCF
jgi:hypothetical protein